MTSAAIMPTNPVRQLLEKRREEILARVREIATPECANMVQELVEIFRTLSMMDAHQPIYVTQLQEGALAGRFTSWRPQKAFIAILKEEGEPMTSAELKQAAINGGITVGKLRAETNLDTAITMNLSSGALVEIAGKIGLPEWKKKK